MCSITGPPCHIAINTVTEVEVSAYSTSPEYYQEKMDEVDTMINAIALVEEEYWGDLFV